MKDNYEELKEANRKLSILLMIAVTFLTLLLTAFAVQQRTTEKAATETLILTSTAMLSYCIQTNNLTMDKFQEDFLINKTLELIHHER